MKNFSIILAMLFLAFTVEAQNNEREARSANTSVKKATEKAPATQAVRSSSSSGAARTTTPPTRTTPTEVRKSTETRTNTGATPPARTSTSTSTRQAETRSAGTATPPTRTSTSTTTRQTETRSVGTATPPTRTSTGTTTRTTETRSSGTATPPTRSGSGTTTRTNESRSSGSATPPTRTTTTTRTRTTGTNASRSDGDRTVNTDRSRNSNSSHVYTPRTAVRDAETRRVYTTPHTNRVVRTAPNVHYTYQSVDYRRVHNPYNEPYVTAIYWNSNMYHNYRTWYPEFNLWYYPYGYRIHTISAYDAYSYIGEIARVYGRVSEVWYSGETREYYLYIGGPYPYQDFTVILDYSDARRFSRNPARYFTDRHITVTGLVSMFEDKPEIQVRRHTQVSLY